MKKFSVKHASAVAVAALLALSACQPNADVPTVGQQQTNGVAVPGSYIVKFRNEDLPTARRSVGGDYFQDVQAMESYTQSYLRRAGVEVASGDVFQTYVGEFSGFAARLSEAEANTLRSRADVEFVEQDRVWTLEMPDFPEVQASVNGVSTQAAQTTPWGVARVNAPNTLSSGVGKVAWVIDTGVDLTHPDLTVDAGRSKEFVTSGAGSSTVKDGNGHGTHVSGTIGALNNNIGVVGVAAGATIVAVKVLNDRGSGSTSDIVKGCNYVANTAAPGDVANMSLGGGVSTALDNAAIAIGNKGIYLCMAAGNSSANAKNFSPARATGTNLNTVSASDNTDTYASFSNYGNPPIDICEPGVSILSTYKNGGYATLSGTSMASPHAAGILLVRGSNTFGNGGKVKNDPDGNPDTIGVIP
jgi:subtilisin family serine protease